MGIELSPAAYLWLKALHVVAFVAWMAGLLYLPRLFVYHTDAMPGSQLSETFKVMERRLLRAIMHPALALVLASGGLLLAQLGAAALATGWLWAKLAGVLGLVVMHGLMARWRDDFARDLNARPRRFYRVANEVPTVLLIAIVVLAVVKPF